MMRPNSVVRALLAVAAMGAAQSCTVKQNESPDLLGPSTLQSPPGPAAPVARFTFTPDKPQASVPVAFDGRSSCPESGFQGGCISSDRSITSFTWDFGDGTTDSGPTVSHSFKSTGSFNVTLTVQNDRGLTSSTSKGVQVDPGTPPKADFVFSPTNPGVGQSVQFNGAQSTAAPGHNIASYAWDFGDGAKGSGITATHTYVSAGGYNAVLTVTDEVGQTNAAAKSVPVAASSGPGAPTAEFVFSPTDPSVGQSVLFNATQSKAAAGHSITSYAWNFGDGATGSGVTATHPFSTVGTYAIVLVVTDDLGQTATSSKTVPVKAVGSTPPSASFVFSPSAPVAGQTVTFTATATPSPGRTIASYAWIFGDGTSPASGSSTTHTFSTAATFSVALTVKDDVGQAVTVSNAVTVGSSAPTASFTFSPSAPAVSQLVTFTATAAATTGRTIAGYTWNFGDGTSQGSGQTPTHTFTTAATFSVALTVTDDIGQTFTVTNQVTVTSASTPAPPTATFIYSPANPTNNQPIFFDGTLSKAATGQVLTTYAWNFGDGTIESGPSTFATRTHTFTGIAKFNVTLTVTQTDGQSKISDKQEVTVTNGNPTAAFTISPTAPLTFSFNGSGSSAVGPSSIVSYAWAFGDNTFAPPTASPTVSHTFAGPGSYNVTLTVTDTFNRTAVITQSVVVP